MSGTDNHGHVSLRRSYRNFQLFIIKKLFHCGDRLYTSESADCRRQILTYKDGPRNERIKIFIMVANP